MQNKASSGRLGVSTVPLWAKVLVHCITAPWVFMLTLHQARLVGVPRCPRGHGEVFLDNLLGTFTEKNGICLSTLGFTMIDCNWSCSCGNQRWHHKSSEIHLSSFLFLMTIGLINNNGSIRRGPFSHCQKRQALLGFHPKPVERRR